MGPGGVDALRLGAWRELVASGLERVDDGAVGGVVRVLVVQRAIHVAFEALAALALAAATLAPIGATTLVAVAVAVAVVVAVVVAVAVAITGVIIVVVSA